MMDEIQEKINPDINCGNPKIYNEPQKGGTKYERRIFLPESDPVERIDYRLKKLIAELHDRYKP